MLNFHCPASGYRDYNENFLVCPIMVCAPENLLVDWGLRCLGRRGWEGGGHSAHGRGDAVHWLSRGVVHQPQLHGKTVKKHMVKLTLKAEIH
jgi:hypothetical protein